MFVTTYFVVLNLDTTPNIWRASSERLWRLFSTFEMNIGSKKVSASNNCKKKQQPWRLGAKSVTTHAFFVNFWVPKTRATGIPSSEIWTSVFIVITDVTFSQNDRIWEGTEVVLISKLKNRNEYWTKINLPRLKCVFCFWEASKPR